MLKHNQILKKLFLISTDTLIFQSKLNVFQMVNDPSYIIK